MRKQRDINHEMRTILVDWLVEVALEYKLEDQTLHLTVAFVDRFLSEMAVQRGKLQLVGVTCMLLASKYEEIYPPCVDDFVYITDNTYSKEQVLKMEHVVLKVLQFNMGSCSALTFMDHFLLKVQASPEIGYLAKVCCHCLA
jgi:cyclin A